VDARISIAPDDTNGIGEDHIFTVTVEKNEGQGAGWVAADDGTIVTVTLTDSNGASSTVSADNCATGTSGLQQRGHHGRPRLGDHRQRRSEPVPRD
jgi:hypothetical protein